MLEITKQLYERKKNVFLFLVALSFAVPISLVIAQTFTGPNCSAGQCTGAIGLDTNQNLSIGTSTPQSDTKLFIVGTSTGASYYAVKVVDAKKGPLFIVRSDGSVTIGSKLFTDTTSANGVGTNSTVSGGLYVYGPIFATGGYTGTIGASNVAGGVFSTCGSCTNSNFAFPLSLGVGTSSQVNLPQPLSVYGNGYVSGNVGIGTVTPGYKLDVTGQINASTGLCINGTCRASWPSGTVTSITAGTGLTGGTITTAGTIALATPVSVANGGTGLGTTPANGSIDIGNGTGFTRSPLTAGTGITVTNGVGSITIAATGGSQWTTSGSNIYYNTGNVGIGTASPGALLSLGAGAGNVKLAVYDGGAGAAQGFGTASGEFRILYPTTNHISFGTWDGTTFSEKVRIDQNGNVGVGTTAPGYKLDVSGDVNTTGVFRTNGVQARIFGGTYEYYLGGNQPSCPVSGTAVLNNPFTGGQSCPSGYSSFISFQTFDSVNTRCMTTCYR